MPQWPLTVLPKLAEIDHQIVDTVTDDRSGLQF